MTPAFSYDGDAAVVCAELSRLVYDMPYLIRQRVAAIVPDAQLAVRTFPHRNFRVMVVTGDHAIYVVFRGTVFDSLRSWQANLTVTRKNWLNGKVHQGFLDLLDHAGAVFKPILADPANREKQLYFTGHSQGAAVAFLAAMDNTRAIATSKRADNYTFGQPRTGNKQFCRIAETRLSGSCSRIANRRDLVVGVPYVWQGYDHVRDFLHYDASGTIVRRQQSAGAGWPVFGSVGDHSMTIYLAGAKKNAAVEP